MAGIVQRIVQKYVTMSNQVCAVTMESFRHGNLMKNSAMNQLLQITSNHHCNERQEILLSTKHFAFKRHCSHSSLCCLLSASCGSRHYSMNRKNHEFPELRPEDLEENFVRGSGPGGQAVNQTANCVVLKHIPSGIVVKCHDTRSLTENRKIARQRLEEKLDFNLHGDQSYLGQQRIQHKKEKMDKRKRSKEKLALKKAFKEKSTEILD